MSRSQPNAVRAGRALTDIRLTELSNGQFLNWIRIILGLEPYYRAPPRRRARS